MNNPSRLDSPRSWSPHRLSLVLAMCGLALAAACGPSRAPNDVSPSTGRGSAATPDCPPIAEQSPGRAGAELRPAFRPIAGFDGAVNDRIAAFLAAHDAQAGRKVAVFDGDGTTLGQAPHYLADECLYELAAREPARKPELLEQMGKISNVSVPYLQGRVRFLAGLSVAAVRDLGDRCFRERYADKIFPGMRELIGQLQEHGFEVWVVTGSPEVLYQQFLSRELGIALTHVVGVKSVIRGGIVTDEIVHPVPQDAGKREAIETVVQATPLIAGGNSRGDREMIEFSTGLRIIVNPDEHVAEGDTESMAAYAARQGWLVIRQLDEPSPGFPAISSKKYGIRTNKTHVLP